MSTKTSAVHRRTISPIVTTFDRQASTVHGRQTDTRTTREIGDLSNDETCSTIAVRSTLQHSLGAASRVMTVEQAAAELQVSPKTIRDWRYRQSKGRPAPPIEFRKYGGVVRVTTESVMALLDRGC